MPHPMPAAAFAAAAGLSLPIVVQGVLLRRQCLPVVATALWLFFANVVYGVNALVWAGSDAIRIPVWCDIATKFLVGSAYAIPACLLCTTIKLKLAVAPRDLPDERTAKGQRSAYLLDLALCVGVPVISMILHTVVQDHRFDIVENIGCQPEIPAISASTIFFWLPALLLALLSFFSCCIMLRYIFGPNRLQLRHNLEMFDSTSTISVFFSQFMIVLCVAALWTAYLLVMIYEALLLTSKLPDGLSRSADWSRIDSYTWVDFDSLSRRDRNFCWWTTPAAALAFTFWSTVFPVVEKVDSWLCRVFRCIRTGLRTRSSSITLKEMNASKHKGSGSHVIIRKDSVVTVIYDDTGTSKQAHSPRSPPWSPAKPAYEPRRSIPWETARPFNGPPGRRCSAGTEDGSQEIVIRELPIAASPLDRHVPPQSTFPHAWQEPPVVVPRYAEESPV
ncbi:uncharacterized protein PHACADRAFT_261026 [Phanerochaete carnosa HHB-10118-sp]|uniref:Uncharacterized protein n=1 Tax=Phanerochaete carnosa (strain HHB-10118-sp) TaxID=650164 RepID=K5WQB3_PHACS|nr:uncharacterized protein PHACADRAFT_261026 [Phanerochaete carnosa HHB-10118-sp]EKM52537.1 hypothetical protein PHACADRAFT_261026 [Phanerochaete carnosa HHB-10118-sp]